MCSTDAHGGINEIQGKRVSHELATSQVALGTDFENRFARAERAHEEIRFVGSERRRAASRRLRDQLCLLIRKYNLDSSLVKAYAADFCGTQELREASRELVESFIAVLAKQAVADRDGLICKLNSYGHQEAVQS
jgi:hypothetical protein